LLNLITPNYSILTSNVILQTKTVFKTTNWLKLSHKFRNDLLKIQSIKSMSQNNNFAYRVEERKELNGLASSNNKSWQAYVN